MRLGTPIDDRLRDDPDGLNQGGGPATTVAPQRGSIGQAAVIRELQLLAAEGVAPTARALLPTRKPLVSRVRQHFRDFSLARAAARLAHREPATPSDVLEELRALAAVGVPITRSGLRSVAERQLLFLACRYFGSARKAAIAMEEQGPVEARAAILKIEATEPPVEPTLERPRRRTRRSRYANVRTEDDVIRALRELAARGMPMLAKPIRRKGGEMLIKRCYELFGSFVAARDAAGLPKPTTVGAPLMAREAIIAALRREAEKHGGFAPGAHHFPIELRRSVVSVFGSHAAACAAAGLQRRRGNYKWTRERIVAELRAWVASGKPPTSSALAKERLDLWNAIVRHVGSFPAAFAISERAEAARVRPPSPTIARRKGKALTERRRAAVRKRLEDTVAQMLVVLRRDLTTAANAAVAAILEPLVQGLLHWAVDARRSVRATSTAGRG